MCIKLLFCFASLRTKYVLHTKCEGWVRLAQEEEGPSRGSRDSRDALTGEETQFLSGGGGGYDDYAEEEDVAALAGW